MSALSVRIEPDPDATTVALEGELDLATREEAEAALLQAEAAGPKLLMLDLRGLDFMDSTGVQVVLAAELRARTAGWGFAVVRGEGTVAKLLRLTRLEERLRVVDDPAEALRAGSG